MCEHTIHRDLAVGNKAGAVGLADGVESPGRQNGELLADHIRTDVDGDVIAFPDKADGPPGTRAAHRSDARVRRRTAIEGQIRAFAVRQLFDRRNRLLGFRINGDVSPERLRQPQALGTDVYRDDARAHGLGEHGGAEPDGALTENRNGVTTRQVQAAQGSKGRACAAGNGGPSGKRQLIG